MDQVLAGLQSALEGRYVLERELGRGEMAMVYLAGDRRHGRSVAVKVLWSELAANLGPIAFDARSISPPGFSTRTSFRSTTRAKRLASSGSPCPMLRARVSGPVPRRQ